MIKFGGDLDDMDNPADPFGLRGQVEQAVFEQTAAALRQMGQCGTRLNHPDGTVQFCLLDWDRCTEHNPAFRYEQAVREVSFFDKYVGVVRSWLKRAKY